MKTKKIRAGARWEKGATVLFQGTLDPFRGE